MNLNIWDIVFLKAELFFIFMLFFIIIWVLLLWAYKKNAPAISFKNDLEEAGFWFSTLALLRTFFIVLSCIIFALIVADPHKTNIQEDITKNWIDIILALDVSKSMEASDLQPNRIEAAKRVLANFVDELSSDKVWLIVFAGKPYASIPMSYDYSIIEETLNNLSTDSLNQNVNWLDGTAIWDAILLGDSLLKKQENPSKEQIIILLTDWDANRWVEPILATKYLENIKVYTIGIWSREWWIITQQNWPFTQEVRIPPLDDTTLREISRISDGKFYRATNDEELSNIFKDIEKLEKTDSTINIQRLEVAYYTIFYIFLLISLGMVFILHSLKNTKWNFKI